MTPSFPDGSAESLRSGVITPATRSISRRTSDFELARFADAEGRILVSKDDDFVVSNLQDGKPEKLLFVSTGNIDNDSLIALFEEKVELLAELFETNSFVEISQSLVIVHR